MAIVSALDHGAVGDGVVDDTAAIQALLMSVAPDTWIHFPAGYRFRVVGSSAGWSGPVPTPGRGAVFHITKRVTLFGGGTIFNDDPGTVFAQGRGSSWPVIYAEAPCLVEGLTFEGLNNPWQGINAYVSETAATVIAESHDVTVRKCVFKWQFGHTIRERGFWSRVHSIDNLHFECTNGLNINAKYSMQIGNELIRCNGIETCGDFAVVIGNRGFETHGISIGGKGGPAPTIGCLVLRNVFDRIIRGGAVSLGGVAGSHIEDNTFTNCDFLAVGEPGLHLYDSYAVNVPGWITGFAGKNWIRRNTFTSVGHGHLMYIESGDNSIFEDNSLISATALFAMHIRGGNNLVLRRNICQGKAGDINIEPPADVSVTIFAHGNTGVIRPWPAAPGSVVIVLPASPSSFDPEENILAKIALTVTLTPPPAVELRLESVSGIHDDSPTQITAQLAAYASVGNNSERFRDVTLVIKDGVPGQAGTESLGVRRSLSPYIGLEEKRIIVSGAMTDAATAWYNAGNADGLTKTQRLEARKQALLTHLLATGIIDSSLTGSVT